MLLTVGVAGGERVPPALLGLYFFGNCPGDFYLGNIYHGEKIGLNNILGIRRHMWLVIMLLGFLICFI